MYSTPKSDRANLLIYLNTLTITSDNIGDIRRSLFFPWESPWNGWVRDLTAQLENRGPSSGSARTDGAVDRDSEAGTDRPRAHEASALADPTLAAAPAPQDPPRPLVCDEHCWHETLACCRCTARQALDERRAVYVLNACDWLDKIRATLRTVPVPIIERHLAAAIAQLRAGASGIPPPPPNAEK